MSIGSLLARAVGLGLVGLAGWFWYQGQPALVIMIAGGAGIACWLSAGLSRP